MASHISQPWGFVYPASCCTNCFQDSFVSVVSMLFMLEVRDYETVNHSHLQQPEHFSLLLARFLHEDINGYVNMSLFSIQFVYSQILGGSSLIISYHLSLYIVLVVICGCEMCAEHQKQAPVVES